MKTLWTPTPKMIAQSSLTQYINWLRAEKSLVFDDYDALWQWSVDEVAAFWESIVQYYEVDILYSTVFEGKMPHVQWFDGAMLNYTEQVFRQANTDFPAIVFKTESSDLQTISWATLRQQVAALSTFFRVSGIKPGDCIVAYLPNCPQAIVGFLAAAAVGAVWSSASPDFGTNSVIERFGQIEPKILLAVNGYQYGGKVFDKMADVAQLQAAIPSIQNTVLIDYIADCKSATPLFEILTGATFAPAQQQGIGFAIRTWTSIIENKSADLTFEQVPFSHPIWVVYSSGTTGMPKAITHSQGGTLLEYYKSHGLHNNIKRGDRYFWFSTTGWIMWNFAQGALLAGATLVLFDGNPNYPNSETLWELVEDAQITHFGTGAAYILGCMKADINPQKYNLSSLAIIGSTGSPLPTEGFEWIYENVSKTASLASLSGGTDVSSGFVGGCVNLPVHAGEIQCRMLGCAVEAWDENGHALIDEVGELVITKPMPNMPIYFWNDTDFAKYNASYFDVYEGVWRHGDWVKITPNGGVVISGRSDATLNRQGIRIGTSEIYRVVEQIESIQDSLILNIDYDNGTSWMPLFVQMKTGEVLTDGIIEQIKQNLKTQCSPRYVPDQVIEIEEVPYTISGKKMEVPIKKILMGIAHEKAINYGAMKNPGSVAVFLKLSDTL